MTHSSPNSSNSAALISALQQQVGALETQLSAAEPFILLAERAPDGISIVDMQQVILYANPAYQKMTGYGAQTIGLTMEKVLAPNALDRIRLHIDELFNTGSLDMVIQYQRADGSIFSGHISSFLLPGSVLEDHKIVTITRDITEYLQSNAERASLREQVIAAQREALRELSTPTIPITDGVLVMPLIGTIDSHRAQQIIETLLSEVAEHQAHTAIIDITGVGVVDTQVANALIKAANAVRLLGAEVELTGVRPEVAQTLVGLGVSLEGIATYSTLQAGVTVALRKSKIKLH